MRPIAWQTSARLQIPASPAFRAETTERPRAGGRGSQAPRHALGAGADERPVTRWAPGQPKAPSRPNPEAPGRALARFPIPPTPGSPWHARMRGLPTARRHAHPLLPWSDGDIAYVLGAQKPRAALLDHIDARGIGMPI